MSTWERRGCFCLAAADPSAALLAATAAPGQAAEGRAEGEAARIRIASFVVCSPPPTEDALWSPERSWRSTTSG